MKMKSCGMRGKEGWRAKKREDKVNDDRVKEGHVKGGMLGDSVIKTVLDLVIITCE